MLSENTANPLQLISATVSSQLLGAKTDTEDSHSFAQEFSSLLDRSETQDASEKAVEVDTSPAALTLIAAVEPSEKTLISAHAKTQSAPQIMLENSVMPNEIAKNTLDTNISSAAPQKTAHLQRAGTLNLKPISAPTHTDSQGQPLQTELTAETVLHANKVDRIIIEPSNIPAASPPTIDDAPQAVSMHSDKADNLETGKANAPPQPDMRVDTRFAQSALPNLDKDNLQPSKADTATPHAVNAEEISRSQKPGKQTKHPLTSNAVVPDSEARALKASTLPISEVPPTIQTTTGDMTADLLTTHATVAITQPTSAASSALTPAQHPSLLTQPAVAMTALPEVVGDLITAKDEASDRVIVKLDPPELGRVSVDFKFDALGLQTITVTAETPEALRKLRSMHHELIQILEQNGLSEKNLSLSDNGGRQHAQQHFVFEQLSAVTAETALEVTQKTTTLINEPPTPQDIYALTTNGLNLKL